MSYKTIRGQDFQKQMRHVMSAVEKRQESFILVRYQYPIGMVIPMQLFIELITAAGRLDLMPTAKDLMKSKS